LNQGLKLIRAFLITLAFDFLGEFIDCDEVVLIQLDCFAQLFDRGRRVAATTFEQSEKIMNVAVIRREIARLVKSLGGSVVVSLAECEQSPVGPTGRFGRRELSKLRELRVGLNIMAHLERGESDVERSHQLVVLGRRLAWELCGWATAAEQSC